MSSSSADSAAPDASDAGAYSPRAMTGLVLWLEGSRGVIPSGSQVRTWSDQSGKSNDAVTTTASTGPATGTLKGKPAVVFNRDARIEIADNASRQWGTGDFDGVARLVGMRRKGDLLEVRLNGTAVGSLVDAGVARDIRAQSPGHRSFANQHEHRDAPP